MLELCPIRCLMLDDTEIEAFDCGNDSINDYFKKRADDIDFNNIAKTFVLLKDNNIIVGFYTLTVGSLDVESVETQTLIKRPIVNLSYFAIDSKYQRQGYGTSLMQEIFKSVSVISYYTGVELVYLESVDDSVCFYESLGFQLVRPFLRPENYQGISTENIQFPMYISIETLIDQGFVGYLHNFLNINIEE